MQHELHNKASIFKFHLLAARRLYDTVKHKGFNDFSTFRYLKTAKFGHSIVYRHTIWYSPVHLLEADVSEFSRSFYKAL